MQLSKVTSISAKNLIPVYGVESKVKVQQIKPKATTNFFQVVKTQSVLLPLLRITKQKRVGLSQATKLTVGWPQGAEVNK